MKRRGWVLATLSIFVAWGIEARADLIVNGGFETGDFTGWTVNVGFGTGVHTAGYGGLYPHSETYFAALGDSGSLGTLSQTISDSSGQNYTLSMYLGSNGSAPNEFKVQWHGTTLYDQTNLPDTRANASQYNLLSFTVQGTGTDTLTLFERNDSGHLALDDVSLNPATVPEPSSLTLLGIVVGSLCSVAWLRRRYHLRTSDEV